ncbi:MAG TPA: hypothetical protein DGQ94_19040 [Pseudomonas sp.]|nr:hypothetical protein [Pseudomonas sp.]
MFSLMHKQSPFIQRSKDVIMSKASNNSLFFYQGNKLVTVKQGDQHRTIFRHEAQPLAEHQVGGDQSTALLATDDKGSVLVAADEGDLEEHLYSAYGHDPTLTSTRTTACFNSEILDLSSTCYLLGHGYRAYSARLSRFLAADSWSPFGQGGLNAYCYCEGDPINSSDPSGHMRTYLSNGQIMITRENIAMAGGSWLKSPNFNTAAHRKRLIGSKLNKPLRVKADNPVTERSTDNRVFELFRNPSTNTEVAHVKATDVETFKRNRAEIGVLTRLHYEGDKAPALNYLEKAASLMNENEIIARSGEALWRKSTTPVSPNTTPAADANTQIRRSQS